MRLLKNWPSHKYSSRLSKTQIVKRLRKSHKKHDHDHLTMMMLMMMMMMLMMMMNMMMMMIRVRVSLQTAPPLAVGQPSHTVTSLTDTQTIRLYHDNVGDDWVS